MFKKNFWRLNFWQFLGHSAAISALVIVAGCQTTPSVEKPSERSADSGLTLIQAQWSDLPGWPDRAVEQAIDPFRRSCGVIQNRDRLSSLGPEGIGGLVADWQPICAALTALPKPVDAETTQEFFEKYFRPAAVAFSSGKTEGLFTGYYEPLLHGARHPGPRYKVPLFRRPGDLVSVDLGQFRPAFKGEKIAGRVVGTKLVPYANRSQITDGALDPVNDALIWVDDQVDALH